MAKYHMTVTLSSSPDCWARGEGMGPLLPPRKELHDTSAAFSFTSVTTCVYTALSRYKSVARREPFYYCTVLKKPP